MAKKRLNRIKETLELQGKSQFWLSGKAKITYSSVNMYCTGKREPSLETLEKIAKALKISPKDLISD